MENLGPEIKGIFEVSKLIEEEIVGDGEQKNPILKSLIVKKSNYSSGH